MTTTTAPAEELRRPNRYTPERVAALIAARDRVRANNERARTERLADKHGVIGGSL